MSAYLKFFQLEKSPFDTRAQSNLVLGTQALRSAFGEIEAGLADGAPRICVGGKAGLGKTSLARALPKLLGDDARVVLILNPSLPWNTLRAAVVKQLDLAEGNLSRKTLMRARAEGRKLVIVVDQAERISSESLEHLDILLGYKNDDDAQLIHCVLLANLDAAASIHTDQGEQCPLLWWLDRLNTLQLEFHPIPSTGVASYVSKHLKRAGWKGGQLFEPEAMQTIHRLTGGVPREMSELCERALELAAEREAECIDVEMVEACFGEIPLEDPVDGGDDLAHAQGRASTDDRSEYERTGPALIERKRGGSPAEDQTEVMAPDDAHMESTDDPRIDRMPGAGRRASGAGEAPVSLDSFFGDSGFGDSAPSSGPSVQPESAVEAEPTPLSDDLDARHEEPQSERSGSLMRNLAIAAGLLVIAGVGSIAALSLLGGGADDGASASKPTVLARPKPAPVREPTPVAGIEPAFNVEAPLPGQGDAADPNALRMAGGGDPSLGLPLEESSAPRAGATAVRPTPRIIDRTTDEEPSFLDDLEQAIGGPADAQGALSGARPTSTASDESVPASPAPAPGLQNPADAEVDAPFW